MDLSRILGVALCAAWLSGCALAARVDSQNAYQKSTAVYKSCLASNPSAPGNCEASRLIMEADERQFNNIVASQSDANITVTNRR